MKRSFPFSLAINSICHFFVCFSGSGKSYFLRELCQNYRSLITPSLKPTDPPIIFLYIYQAEKPSISVPKHDMLYFMHGMPTWETLEGWYSKYERNNSGFVLIYDDCLSDLESLSESETEKMTRLVTQWSRHRNISLYFTLQNTFIKSRVIRTLRANLEQLLLFSVTSGQSSVYLLLSKLLGSQNSRITRQAYHKSTKLAKGLFYGYLAIDFRISNGIVRKYRMRNFFASFKNAAKQHKLKALTRPDMCLYQLDT